MTKKLRFELSEIIYCIPVPMKPFARLLRREDEDLGITHPTLAQDLKAVEGIRKVDYSGHFGSCIYIQIDADYDGDTLKGRVTEVISKHLATQWSQ